MPRVKHGATGHLQEEVVVRGTRHTPASPNGARHANLVKGQSISIEGQYAGNYPRSMYFARPKRPLSTQTPPNNQRMTSMGLDAAPPITSAGLDAAPLITSAGSNRSQTEMKALCRPAVPRPLKPKAGNDRGHYTKKQVKPPTNHNLAMRLDQPNTYWRCPFCPVEYNALMDLRAHNAKHHGGQLFGLECGQCGFQTDSPKLLREHQSRVHEGKEANIIDRKAADAPADTAISAPNASNENTSATPIGKDNRTFAAGAGGTRNKEINRPNKGLDEDGVSQNLPLSPGEQTASPIPGPPHDVPGLPVGTNGPEDAWDGVENDQSEIAGPIQRSMEAISSINDLDNVFVEPSAALQQDIEPRSVKEAEATPITLEDDSSHVICPTCYEYLPLARYTLHRHDRSCHHPARPPEVTKERGLDSRHERGNRGGDHLTWSKRVTEGNDWLRTNRPPVIRKAKQHEIQHWSTNRKKMTAIYKEALRKPNFDGTYNVNGKITSLQELKRQIWDLPRCF